MVNGTAYAKALWDAQKDTYQNLVWSLRYTHGNQSQKKAGGLIIKGLQSYAVELTLYPEGGRVLISLARMSLGWMDSLYFSLW